jgi:hypothetical protein
MGVWNREGGLVRKLATGTRVDGGCREITGGVQAGGFGDTVPRQGSICGGHCMAVSNCSSTLTMQAPL